MSDSEISIQNISYKNRNGDNLLEDKTKNKPQSTDTDFYFNMIANPSKTVINAHSETSESESSSVKKDSETSQRRSSLPASPAKSSSSSSPKVSSPKVSSSSVPSPRVHDNVASQQVEMHSQVPSQQTKFVPHVPPTNSFVDNESKMSPQELRMKKIELLRRLSEIKTKGYKLSIEYDFNSNVDEMQYEYELLKSFAEKRNGIKIYKNIILNVTSAVEFLNDKYDPFDFHLSGWSEHLSYDVDNYDDVLEDLYEKYKGSGRKMPPEIKLFLLIVASASAFHFTKSQSSAVKAAGHGAQPILNSFMNSKKESSQFMTEQEINIEKLRNELKNKSVEHNNTSSPVASNVKPPIIQSQVNIKASENVKDILSRIHNIQPNKINNNTETQDESATNDRLVSESSLSDSSKKKARTKKKSNISIV